MISCKRYEVFKLAAIYSVYVLYVNESVRSSMLHYGLGVNHGVSLSSIEYIKKRPIEIRNYIQ